MVPRGFGEFWYPNKELVKLFILIKNILYCVEIIYFRRKRNLNNKDNVTIDENKRGRGDKRETRTTVQEARTTKREATAIQLRKEI